MTTIYLIRHGQASFGTNNYDQLSEKGYQQAQHLGQYLTQLLDHTPYIVTGSMQRHQQTAQNALQNFENFNMQQNAAWNEFDHEQVFAQYDPNFLNPEHLKAQIEQYGDIRLYLEHIFEGAIEQWTSGKYDEKYRESWLDFKHRVEVNALKQLCKEIEVHQPQSALAFTSGGVISVITGQLLGLSVQQTFALNWSIANTSMTVLQFKNGKLQLMSFNEYHYLQAMNPELLTWI